MRKISIIFLLLICFILITENFSNSEEITPDEITNLEKELNIISRKDWEAKQPIKEMKIHHPDRITIHHSGIIYPAGVNLTDKMKSLQNYSQSSEKMANGKIKEIWADVPYHFVISGTGQIAEGREIIFSGDTNTEYNPENHILIDILGNFEVQEPTDRQINSMIKLCSYLCKKYKIQPEQIKGHNYYAKTDCPGKNLSKIITKIYEK